MTPSKLHSVHASSSFNRQKIQGTAESSCFYCLKHFKGTTIVEWIDGGETAVCPHCGIDSVLPSSWGTEALQEMHDYWFGRIAATYVDGKFERNERESVSKIKFTSTKPFSLREIQRAIYAGAKSKGFWSPERQNLYEKLALVTTEVSEVVECLRDGADPGDIDLVDGKPEGVGPELADIVIRVLDIAEHLGIDMEEMIMMKHLHNKTRPFMHGKKA